MELGGLRVLLLKHALGTLRSYFSGHQPTRTKRTRLSSVQLSLQVPVTQSKRRCFFSPPEAPSVKTRTLLPHLQGQSLLEAQHLQHTVPRLAL